MPNSQPRDPSLTLERLEHRARSIPDFSDDERAELHKIIEAYRGWQVLGKATKWLVLLLAGLSGLIIALSQIKEALKSWLT